MKFFGTLIFSLIAITVSAQSEEINLRSCDDGEAKILCGEVNVPMIWGTNHDRYLTLPVKVFKATGTSQGVLFWLTGGPGESNMTYNPDENLRTNFDVILVGYRGIDGSVVLSCPDIEKALKGVGDNLLSMESVKGIQSGSRACVNTLRKEGVNLNSFTIRQVINDFEAVRKALNYEKIHLLAASYGTRVSQIYMRVFPNSIEKAVLVGAGVPGGFVWTEDVIAEQLNELDKLCQVDIECAKRSSNLYKTFNEVLDSMPNRWLLFNIDSGKVRATTFGMLYHTESASFAVDSYLAAAKGDYSGLAMLSLAYDFIVPEMMVWGDFFSKGLIDYDPSVDYYQSLEVEKKTSFGSPFSSLLMDVGSVWSTVQDTIDESKPIPHDILILNGTLDFSTPLNRIKNELLPLLPNGVVVEFPGSGHVSDIFYREDVKKALPDFYKAGEISLAPQEMVFDFDPAFGFPEIAKLVTIAVGVLIVLLGFIANKSRKILRSKFHY